MGKMLRGIALGGYKLGTLIAHWPKTIITVFLLLSIACCLGWLNYHSQDDGNVLWVPRSSEAQSDSDWLDDNFGQSGTGANFVVTTKESTPTDIVGNALQLPIVYGMFSLDALVQNITVNYQGKNYRFSDICFKNNDGQCEAQGFFNYWSMSFTDYLASVGGDMSNATTGNQTQLLVDVNTLTFPDGSSASTLSIFAGLNVTGNTGIFFSGVQAISVVYNIDNSVPKDLYDDWFDSYIDVMKAWHSDYFNIAFMAGNSVDTEMASSVSSNLYLVGIAFLLFLVVALLGQSKWDRVLTRTSLGLIGILTAALGMMAGYGLSFLFNQPFTMLTQVLPYILLGVAIDMMFILVNAYEAIMDKDPDATMATHLGELMSTAGMSVVGTSLTSCVAFAFGTMNELPSIAWFSAFATLGIAAIMVVMSTIFVAALHLTQIRIKANRLDCICCVTSSKPPQSSLTQPPVVITLADKPASNAVGFGSGGSMTRRGPSRSSQAAHTGSELATAVNPSPAPVNPHRANSHGWLGTFMGRYYGPAILSWPGMVVVLGLFTTMIVLSGLAIPHLKKGQPVTEVVPDSSYLVTLNDVMDNTFNEQTGSVVNMYFRYFDPSPVNTQKEMYGALNLTLQNSYINSTISGFQGNWLVKFTQWVAEQNVTLEPGCKNPVSEYLFAAATYLARNNSTKTTAELLYAAAEESVITGCVPQEVFYPMLTVWLALPEYTTYNDSLLIVTNSSGQITMVTASMFSVVTTAPGSSNSYGQYMLSSLRDTEGTINNDVFPMQNAQASTNVFFYYNSNFIQYEGDLILGDMTLEYILLALLGVGIVMWLMLTHPVIVLELVVAVGLVDLLLFGEMYVLGIAFNQVSVIVMVMATGLAVDYSVYLAQKVMNTRTDLPGMEGRKERVLSALSETGASVLMGGTTALIGTIPLAFANVQTLRVLFFMMFGTIVFALGAGLMLLPVAFVLMLPQPLMTEGVGPTVAPAVKSTELTHHQPLDGAPARVMSSASQLRAVSAASNRSNPTDARVAELYTVGSGQQV